MNEKLEKFRVWPDGTVQQVSEPELIYSWMSDDYQVVEAVDEEHALRKARLAERPPPTSTYYCKAFCVKCLTDRNRTGGVWRNRMFFCGGCK